MGGAHRVVIAVSTVLLLILAVTGCGSSGGSNDGPPQSHARSAHAQLKAKQHEARRRERRARARMRAVANARRQAARNRQLAALGCPDPSRVLAGVYHPDRLSVRDPCRRVAGVVDDVRYEEDGDIHVLVRLDHQYDGMLMANNRSEQDGDLVVEFMPRDNGHLPPPSTGDRLMLVGAYVCDTEHSWAELHPVWAVSVNGGRINRSGPQYGGSPAYALSSNALATCHTNSGARCHGYNGEVAPPPDDETGGNGGGRAAGSSSGSGCTPGYSPCIRPGPDVDCAGGGGDGPRYVQGPVRVTGSDPYDLDSDDNGIGCQ